MLEDQYRLREADNTEDSKNSKKSGDIKTAAILGAAFLAVGVYFAGKMAGVGASRVAETIRSARKDFDNFGIEPERNVENQLLADLARVSGNFMDTVATTTPPPHVSGEGHSVTASDAGTPPGHLPPRGEQM